MVLARGAMVQMSNQLALLIGGQFALHQCIELVGSQAGIVHGEEFMVKGSNFIHGERP